MRIGIVVGESSGDMLGSDLVANIKKLYPDAQFEGVAGPKMLQQGVASIVPMEKLTVMGIVEVLGRYWELLKIRDYLADYFIQNKPDLFIGIDYPDFNLSLELKLREAGIKTVHYVCPTVWAWRRGRTKKIARAVDKILCLFPFETQYLQHEGIDAEFVGHPLADVIPEQTSDVEKKQARNEFKLKEKGEVVALLPGSRSTEIRYLAETFVQAAQFCVQRRPGIQFVLPVVNAKIRKQIEEIISRQEELPPIRIVDGQSRIAMAAADVVLLASGTATLEALLLKKPMVVAYRVANITYILMKSMAYVKYFSLPNLLSGSQVVPEIFQAKATPEALGGAVLHYLEYPETMNTLHEKFAHIHQQLKRDASVRAARAVLEMINA